METDKDIIIFAFRYALGRMSVAPSIMSNFLMEHWDEISQSDKQLIQREISEAIESDRAGMAIDIACWEEILKLKTEETNHGF